MRVITLARPPVNAIDLSLVESLTEHLVEAEAATGCRALVLTGAGRAFSAGVDTLVVPAYDEALRERMGLAINRMVHALYGLAKPTVAAVNGHALGGGLVLALACDFRVGADGDYHLGLLEVTAGIPFPAVPMIVVKSELGPRVARRLALGGERISPKDPLASEILDMVIPAPRLLEAAVERAVALADLPGYAAVKRQFKDQTLGEIGAALDSVEAFVNMARS
ncbi:MAG: enoyl-CoA hydratase/isomerase family protein [Candidatus Binatia bacterium]